MIDETHSVARRSWVASANGHADFPIQNLPFGVFTPGSGAARGGVAIGDEIFDLAAAAGLGLFDTQAAPAAEAASGVTTQGEMVVKKLLPRKGPSGWYSQP